MAIPVSAPLKATLDAVPRHGDTILANSKGAPWTSDGFRCVWRKTCDRAEIHHITFHDLRGTAVTRMLAAGYTQSQAGAYTGHTLRDVSAFESYVSRAAIMEDQSLIAAAEGTFSNHTSNRSGGSNTNEEKT